MDSNALVKPIVKSTESPEKPEIEYFQHDSIINTLNNDPSRHKKFCYNI